MCTRKIPASLQAIMPTMTKTMIGVMKISNQKKLTQSLAVQGAILKEEQTINNIRSLSHNKIIKKLG